MTKKESLKALIMKYYEDTEEYAKSVCTGPESKYGSTPADKEEFRLTLENCKECFDSLKYEAEALGFSVQEVRAEMRNYVHSGELELDRNLR